MLTKPKITDKYRVKIIADEFAYIEKQYFNFDNLATKSDIKECVCNTVIFDVIFAKNTTLNIFSID